MMALTTTTTKGAKLDEGRATLLVVDDDSFTRRAVVRALDDGTYRVLAASGGAEALEVLSKERVDVILSDQNMPEMSGLDLLRMVRLRHSTTVRLMMTSSEEFDVAVRAINLGDVRRFIRKPWSEDEMVYSVRLAFEEANAARELRVLRAQSRKVVDALRLLEAEHPGISAIRRDAEGAITLDDDALAVADLS